MTSTATLVAAAVTVVAIGALAALAPYPPAGVGILDDRSPAITATTEVTAMGSAIPSVMYLTTLPERDLLVGGGRPATVASIYVPAGRYAIGYEFEMLQSEPPVLTSQVGCAAVVESGEYRLEPGPGEAPTTPGAWAPTHFDVISSVPESTIALRCAPDGPGFSHARLRNLSLFAITLR